MGWGCQSQHNRGTEFRKYTVYGRGGRTMSIIHLDTPEEGVQKMKLEKEVYVIARNLNIIKKGI
jgi:hypothetical protein